MNETSAPRISKVPFFIGDLLLLGVAGWLATRGEALDSIRLALLVGSVALAAWLGIMPFVLQFRADTKVAESANLTSATAQLGNLEALARQIANASSEWQHVHQSTTQTVTAAEQISEKMIAETRNFGEVLARMNEAEKNHLRLEVEKLRRAEGDWLQVLVRLFDHVHALHQAGIRSGQQNVIQQLSGFQHACWETARRLGFVALVPQTGVPFDSRQHTLLEDKQPEAGATINLVVAPGYTFQGQLLRLPVVQVTSAAPAEPKPTEEEKAEPREGQTQLTLDQPV